MDHREYRRAIYRLEKLRFQLGLRSSRPLPPMSWRELRARAARLRVQIEGLWRHNERERSS